jgi:hypothetical protein
MISKCREDPRLRAGIFLCFLITSFVGVGLFSGCNAAVDETEAVKKNLPPLSATFDTPEALAKAFLDALYQKDVESLKTFGLSKEEFRLHVWPELPVSRLEKNPLPFDYGWNDLNQKSTNSLRRTYAAYGGRQLTFIRIEFEDETTPYETFEVHRDARVVVRDEESGKILRLDLFGSIMEKDGRFKLFSYVTD